MMKKETGETLKENVMVKGMFPVITKVGSVSVHAACCCFLRRNVTWKGQFMTTLVKKRSLDVLAHWHTVGIVSLCFLTI